MFFKKPISIVIAFLVMLSSTGFAFSLHYCKDNIAGVSFAFVEEEVCIEKNSCCALSNNHDSCCSNKQILVEKKNYENFFSNLKFSQAVFFLNSFTENLASKKYILIKNKLIEHKHIFANAPPLYKLYCKLVLYA